MKKSIVIFLIIVTMMLVACDNSTTDKNNNEITQKSSVFQLGDTVSTDSMEFTLTAVSREPQFSIVVPPEGYSFIVVDFTLKNIGKTEWGFIDKVDGGSSKQVSSIIYIDYNDGYIFDVDDVKDVNGDIWVEHSFVRPSDSTFYDDEFKPLHEAVDCTVAICVPNEVVTNKDANLLINCILWSSDTSSKVFSFDGR